VHVVQRGNNRHVCFASHADLKAYANWLLEATDKYGIDVHAWVFMTNHVHLLMTPHSADSISHCMQYLGRYYVRYFNNRYRRSGTLFEGRFKSSIVQTEKYFLNCQRYIELNPVRAGMSADPANYSWSSYGAHAFGRRATLWTPHAEYLALGATPKSRQAAYRQFFTKQLSGEVVTDIRNALNTGLVLGSDRFKEQVRELTGVRQHHLKRGPRSENTNDSRS
jgi:putative transposase